MGTGLPAIMGINGSTGHWQACLGGPSSSSYQETVEGPPLYTDHKVLLRIRKDDFGEISQQMPVRAALGQRENPALHVGLFANVEAQKTGHGLRETELEPDKWISSN